MLWKRVYIVILNWNGWADTLECLESVFRNDHPDYRVIVCDNNSQDNSLEYIKAWSEGLLDVLAPVDNSLRNYSFPPVNKPISYTEYDRIEAEAGGKNNKKDERLVLISNKKNLGFAGGNNVGIRYALARGDFDYIWLLNNDTVVKPDALSHMVHRMQEKPDAGTCGSTLVYYHKTGNLQALGGAAYNKWLALTKHIGMFQPPAHPVDLHRVERKLDYIIGASMLISKDFLRDVGLMSEDYFLYCEEIDWAVRGKKRFSLAYAPQSVVYHKEGATSGGSALKPKEKSLTTEYHTVRSRLLFTKKYFPWCYPTVALGMMGRIVIYLWRRKWNSAWMTLRLLFKHR